MQSPQSFHQGHSRAMHRRDGEIRFALRCLPVPREDGVMPGDVKMVDRVTRCTGRGGGGCRVDPCGVDGQPPNRNLDDPNVTYSTAYSLFELVYERRQHATQMTCNADVVLPHNSSRVITRKSKKCSPLLIVVSPDVHWQAILFSMTADSGAPSHFVDNEPIQTASDKRGALHLTVFSVVDRYAGMVEAREGSTRLPS